MNVYTINGNKFRSPKAFYKYAESIFTTGLSWRTGENLDAFADLLEGGFGEHGLGELIKVRWINMVKSRETLPANFYHSLVDILESAENVIFEQVEYQN